MKSILDPSFQYTPSAETDLKKTFARVRRQEKERQQARQMNVTRIKPTDQPSGAAATPRNPPSLREARPLPLVPKGAIR